MNEKVLAVLLFIGVITLLLLSVCLVHQISCRRHSHRLHNVGIQIRSARPLRTLPLHYGEERGDGHVVQIPGYAVTRESVIHQMGIHIRSMVRTWMRHLRYPTQQPTSVTAGHDILIHDFSRPNASPLDTFITSRYLLACDVHLEIKEIYSCYLYPSCIDSADSVLVPPSLSLCLRSRSVEKDLDSPRLAFAILDTRSHYTHT
ncbi:hypothetical protein PM082_017922 [Marasmius tenuissimus]|nr:hypothetical protein PM082_017922 [Marasmius tenuissimus]